MRQIVKGLRARFTKLDGGEYQAIVVRKDELPGGFMAANTKGGGKSMNLRPGYEVVWSATDCHWLTVNMASCQPLERVPVVF
jgi:hypothetical protein